MDFTDDDVAELYDLANPWDPDRWPSDRFYDGLVAAAGSTLDVGCGTGQMLREARVRGHQGRLLGLDPDPAALGRARRRTDVEWVEGRAADIAWRREFDLATMTGHAFQCLLSDEEVRASLAGIRGALRTGGHFAFETRHPQARAWEQWTRGDSGDIAFTDGRVLRLGYRIEVRGDVVDTTEVTSLAEGTVLREDTGSLRFLDVGPLNVLLAESGFEVEGQYGDWRRGPVTPESGEIITIARAT
ncbi:trans-aconitate 2-methyltransferase [Streptacidiphilus sp. P02-A3a]|uniref:class I SAM-dependent methyltransferase n=1 Tax=Streptacidiphilus sp. P02-A3a TaxID=2704468 RepID=UPI0015FAA02D|nr:class I SAM-dependent methyltransferase [Streptacidiphilus sp. P02-A3a]QMU67438.1 class I SAM-dependent methyltransferase [Streptacidiphilus sp. P02-A3a]